MISREKPLRVTQELIDAEVLDCPALEKFYAAAQRLGKLVIVDQKVTAYGNITQK